MAIIVDSTTIGPLAVGETFTYTFPEKLTPPDFVLPLKVTGIGVFGTPTVTSVTFKNLGTVEDTATFYMTWYYNEATKVVGFEPQVWQGGPVGELPPDPEFTIPPSLATGEDIHYYPELSADDFTPAGLLAEIDTVTNYNQVSVITGGGSLTAYRGGTHGTKYGDPGTFDRLDSRHRRRIRWHLSYGQTFADNLIADPSLIERYNWDEYDYDLINNMDPDSPATLAVFDATIDKYRTLGFNVGFGLLPIAAAHPDPGDPSNGIISIWCNPDFWEPWAERLQSFYDTGGDRLDGWYHSQMEEAFSEQALAVNVLAAGKTRQELIEAMSSYTGVIAAHGSPVIVRPFSAEDWGLLAVLQAGALGSVYCAENDGFSGIQYRRSEFGWRATQGQNKEVWALVRSLAPQHTFPTPFHYESEMKMGGRRIRRDHALENDRYPIIELTMLNEQNGAINVPQIGKTNWWRHTTLVNPPATGNIRASGNDCFQCWQIWTYQEDGMTVQADDAPGTCHDGVAGSSGPSPMRPWKRQVGPFIDAVNNTIPFDEKCRGWVTRKDFDHINQADCYRMDVGSSGQSFTHKFRVILPDEAPGAGVKWGIWSITTTNASAANLIWNGDTGDLELNVRDAVGEQTFTYLTSPTPGDDFIILISYDRAASATGKWWVMDGPAWVTPNIVMNTGNPAILIGCAHDLLDRANVVWGIPNLVLPHNSDNIYWLRALTDDEITCFRDLTRRWPVGGYL